MPQDLDSFIGNEEAKETIKIAVGAALQEVRPVEHILFVGPPGTGKTTLAKIIANTMQTSFVYSVGGSIKTINNIIDNVVFTGLCGIWFIDEIHLLPMKMQEIMLPLIQDFQLQTTKECVYVPPFTLIGATTKLGMLDDAFVERFHYRPPMRLYTDKEISVIIIQALKYAEINNDALDILVSLSKQVPRVALSLVNVKLREFCILHKIKNITPEVVYSMMSVNQIYPEGLTLYDTQYLTALSSGKKGLNTLISLLGDEQIETCEDFLIRKGYVIKEHGGRSITPEGKNYIRRYGIGR